MRTAPVADVHPAQEIIMVETKVPVKTAPKGATFPTVPRAWHPFEALRHDIDRLFEDFRWPAGFWQPSGRGAFDIEPFWRTETTWASAPAVDVVEKDKAYEITAELPGLDINNVEVKVANGILTLKGEKK